MPSSGVRTFKKKRAYRRRLAWGILVASAIFALFQFFLQLSSGQIIGRLMNTFSLTAFGGGILIGSYYYVYLLLQVPAGLLLDRYGPRAILSGGAMVMCIGCALFGTAGSLAFALSGRILMGVGAAFAFVGCLNLISIWFPARQFSFLAALVEAGGMIVSIIGNFWLANFVSSVGWRYAIVMSSVLSGVISILLYLIVRNSSHQKRKQKESAGSLKKGLSQLMTQPIIWVNGIYCGAMFSVITVFIALWAIPFFRLAHHISLVSATVVASALYLGVAVGGPILGWLDHFYRRQILWLTALCGAVLMALCIYWMQIPLYFLAVLLFLLGICASTYVLNFAVASELSAPANRATAIGLTNAICVLFSPILQAIIGYLITYFNGGKTYGMVVTHSLPHFQWALSVMPLLFVIAAILSPLLTRSSVEEIR